MLTDDELELLIFLSDLSMFSFNLDWVCSICRSMSFLSGAEMVEVDEEDDEDEPIFEWYAILLTGPLMSLWLEMTSIKVVVEVDGTWLP